jgi:hypothetical protein
VTVTGPASTATVTSTITGTPSPTPTNCVAKWGQCWCWLYRPYVL